MEFKQIIPKEFFINPNTVNIFCDASITQKDNVWIGAPGAQSYIGDQYFSSYIKCVYDFTVNESELEAIIMGIKMAYNIAMVNIGKQLSFNIISDSMISIKGLTEWIFSWVNSIDKNGIWHNYSGEIVSNQYLFMTIIDFVIKSNIPIHFYHIKGHHDDCITSTGINMNKISKLNDFKTSFNKVNKLIEQYTIDNETARFFILSNIRVDNDTRRELSNPNMQLVKKLKVFPREIPFNSEEMRLYRKIIFS